MKRGQIPTTKGESAKNTPRLGPSAIDLFSGSGGLTLGLQLAGFTVVGGIEVDPLSAESYRGNHPTVRLWEKDIRKVSIPPLMSELDLKAGQLDLLAGCPPCQGFSTIRTRKKRVAVKDSRNTLVSEFIRFIEALLPKAIMIENVPGLADYGRFAKVRENLAALGYQCHYDVFDAADFGVPQRRKRLVLVGSRSALIPMASKSAVRVSVKETIEGLPSVGASGDRLHDIKENRSKRIASMIRLIPKNGGSRTDLPAKYRLDCHVRCSGFKDVYGRMSWDTVAPTITSGCTNPSKGRFLHPEENRAITLREAAMLQGFPPDYFFSLSKGKSGAARLIGNAFPPEFARRFATEIYAALGEGSGS